MLPNKSELRRQHQGNVLTADRLKRGLAYVKRKKVFTSLDMKEDMWGYSVSPRDIIRALRANGVPISPAEYVGMTDKGGRIYRWRYLG